MYDTSYLNTCMQLWAQGIFIFVLTRVFARFQQFCALEASLQIFWNSIGSLSQTLYCAQLNEDITKYKHPPFFLFNFFIKKITLLISNMPSVTSSYIFFKDISCLHSCRCQLCAIPLSFLWSDIYQEPEKRTLLPFYSLFNPRERIL